MENEVSPKTLTSDEDKSLKHLIKVLVNAADQDELKPLNVADVMWLMERVAIIFRKQPVLLEIDTPISICGDIHAQFTDLIRLLNQNGWPPKTRYLFLGDYVDRGPKNVETICLMFALKIRYPDQFYMLRGNHEFRSVNRVYGFYKEMTQRYNAALYDLFNAVFEYMPLTALVSKRILCMHGGVSPDLEDIDQLRAIERPLSEVPEVGLVADLLWSDPESGVSGYVPNPRGISYRFGRDVVIELCDRLELDVIVRAHQVVEEGYEFFADNRMVTIFSAPDYVDQFTNAGGVMSIAEDLSCTIKQLPSKSRKKH